MFKFLNKDPIDKAKRHVEKALKEIEEGYLDYASTEYEKAANLFIEAGSSDFAVKYFREAAYCALEHEDHSRAAQMKLCAAEALLNDTLFDEAGGLYQEASDHLFRAKKIAESLRALALSVMSHLGSRNFDTAVNLLRKMEKRFPDKNPPKVPACDVAKEFVEVLIEGYETTKDNLTNCIQKYKPKDSELELIEFLTNSASIAIATDVRIEWAGKEMPEVSAKTPLEFELLLRCPVPIRIIDYKLDTSNSLTFIKEPAITNVPQTDASFLLTVNPVLSGEGTIGPFKLTISGERILAHKHSNQIKFKIAKAPAQLAVDFTPERISCGIGDEVVFDVTLSNEGEGPADNILVKLALSDGIELSLGGNERSIQFLGANEKMRLQVYVRGISMGDQVVMLSVKDGRSSQEIVKNAYIRVG
ncbi:MAG: hypothetical protein ACFFED_14340 [Candidatus Thorarchaeota archaeon]